MTLLADLVAASAAVAATRSRKTKTARLADVLSGLDPSEVEPAAAFLSGEIRQGRIGLGYRTVHAAEPDPAANATLTVTDVDDALAHIAGLSGPGSGTAKGEALTELLAAATAPEQAFLRGLIVGELRQGALSGVMVEAIARVAGVAAAAVRRAVMLNGDLPTVAAAAIRGGDEALAAFRLTLFRPIEPMLAKTASDVGEAVREMGVAVVDVKLDGARIQVHKDGTRVAVYTRNLSDVTESVPEVVAAVAAVPADSLVLDGEAIALRPDGRPEPFQVTMSRFGRTVDVAEARLDVPLSAFFFDCLHIDGEDLLDEPATARLRRMSSVLPAALLTRRIETDDPATAAAFAAEAAAAGHEGVMVKDPTARYAAGRRGSAWRKVKPVHTLDLVVLAVEWGSGRRRGLLSNIHLGARDPESREWVMLGKTFKGMTDSMLRWQTQRFLDLETHREGHVVYVRPEQVVEVAFDGVQRSSRYPGGMALRFARVKGYREDKSADEADTVDTVRRILEGR